MPNHALFENVKHGSLGNQIFHELRDRILNEKYKNGDKLNEMTLAKEFCISRTPIRESLKQLELEGLVESIPNRGVFVKGFSPRDIDDMFEIRKSLESLAITMAIKRMDESHMKKIQEIFELMVFYTEKKDVKKIADLNILYHEAIYEATKSTYMKQILKDIHYYVSVTSNHSLKGKKRLDSALKEHQGIYQAILTKDTDKAEQMIIAHIEKTQELVREYYKNKEKKDEDSNENTTR